MQISTGQALVIVFVVAVITIFTRALPFLIFGGKKELPKGVAYLGKVLPMAVMGVLVIYCVKGVQLTVYPYGLPEWIGIGIVVLLHIWKRNNLLSIGVGTIAYMIMVQGIF